MKKFFENVFNPYLFPLIILIIGAYLKAGENLSSVTKFFSESTNNFIKYFSRQFYVWEIILYFLVIFILIRLYRFVFKRKSQKEKSMVKATKRIPHEMRFQINGTNDKFLFKYDPKVINEEYFIDNLRPYCMNCSPNPLRMTERGLGYFRCNCGKEIDFNLKRDVESRIITSLEQNEK